MRKNKYVVFMDDDVILLEDTFAKMNKCIEKFGEDPNIAGFGFNQFEDIKPSFMDNLKSLKIFEELGNKSGIAMSLNNIGENYIYQCDQY